MLIGHIMVDEEGNVSVFQYAQQLGVALLGHPAAQPDRDETGGNPGGIYWILTALRVVSPASVLSR